MLETSPAKFPPLIYGEASVISQGGVSLFQTSETITSENVHNFSSTEPNINKAVQALKSHGFNVLNIGDITISIAASKETYERVFKTQLNSQELPVNKGFGQVTTATFFDAANTDTFGLIDTSTSALANLIEGVALNEPIYFFDPVMPLPSPPKTNYWHLEVPEGIAKGLNAELAHQQGLTGRGIKVIMVDSGWYRHPFFVQRGYQGKVLLIPDSQEPEKDENGHGTGESANLFAIAPDIDFTMVKTLLPSSYQSLKTNPIAGLKIAISAQPDIISCSWGLDKPDIYSISASDRVLAATVSDAVRKGIIVIFSAGNGDWGFPAQHPDVISAGGVYLGEDGTLEASDYASGFPSNIYPGVTVPDVCGLVGKGPNANYIMLPVPPQSMIDISRGNTQIGLEGKKYPWGDETKSSDGWAAFSGTSAAAPQIAGICALIKQVNPNLSPRQVRDILRKTARDVIKGQCNPRTGGHQASQGVDLATGYGLVDAFAAIMMAKQEAANNLQNGETFSEVSQSSGKKRIIQKQEIFMDSKLIKHYEEILWALDKALQKSVPEIKDEYELVISPVNLVQRSAMSKAAYRLRHTLDTNADIKLRLSAAEGLLKIGRYQEAVLKFLSEKAFDEIEKIKDNDPEKEKKEKSDLQERVLKALGDIKTQAITSDSGDTVSFYPDHCTQCRVSSDKTKCQT
jgi:serine protease AprX